MARIAGIDLPKGKRGIVGLTYIHGVGSSRAAFILETAKVSPDTKVQDWTDSDISGIREVIGNEFKVEGELRSETQMNIKRLMDLGCYRGLRHRRGLPVRGQRTHTNARTRKGPSKAIAGKKK